MRTIAVMIPCQYHEAMTTRGLHVDSMGHHLNAALFHVPQTLQDIFVEVNLLVNGML
jgi:hypothetical protein